MQVEIKFDRSYTEPKILILTASMSEEINSIVKKLSASLSELQSDISLQSLLLPYGQADITRPVFLN